jgi:hypothetical protein
MKVLALIIVHISAKNVPIAEPGKTTQTGPGGMSRIVASAVDLSTFNFFQRNRQDCNV